VELVEHAVRNKRRVVGISATFVTRRARAELAATVNALKAAGIHVLAGGAAFSRSPALGQQLGIDLVATDSRFAVLYVNRLMRAVRR
jgi:methanogenic corrinoid protein MtbC1